jgi:type IV pilus assembly protein PilW
MTLIELLVGMVVATITVLAIFQVLGVSESYKRTTTGGSDALQNGAFAQYSLQRYITMGGSNYALVTGIFGCPLQAWRSGTLVAGPTSAASGYPEPFKTNIDFNVVVSPVIIRPGSGSAADTVLVFAGQHPTMAWPFSATISPNQVTFKAPVGVNGIQNSSGVAQQDLLIARDQASGTAATTCDIAQAMAPLSSDPKTYALTGSGNVYTGSNAYNNYSPNTQVADIGPQPQLVAFTVGNDGQTPDALLSYNLLTNTLYSLADGIVTMKAAYGVTDVGTDTIVTSWQLPTGSYAPGNLSSGTIPLLRAVRLAVIARNGQRDKTEVTPSGTIDVFPDNSVLKQTITVDKHYRYKVFDVIVPLRQMIYMTNSHYSS